MRNEIITKIFTYTCLLCTSFCFANATYAQSTSTSTSPSPSTITVSTGEWAPLISENLPDYGPISTVVKEAFSQSGIDVTFRFVPWKRAMREVDIGSVDASSAWRSTSDRMQKFLFSHDIYENANVFFYLKSRPFHWETFDDLVKYQIGAVLSYAYSEKFENAEKQGQFEVFRVNKEKLLVDMLFSGRIHAFPANREVGLNLFHSRTPELFHNVAVHPKALIKDPLRLIVKKNAKGQVLINKFNEGLEKLKTSGRFEQIYATGSAE